MRLLALLLLLPATFHLSAQDLAADYARVQEAYTQRLGDIEARLLTTERDLLNRYILSLVRAEQAFRDAGNLDGLVLCRELRERLLTDPRYPEIEDRHPAELRDMTQILLQQRGEARAASQRELDDLNRAFLGALERYQREFTRLGEIETAIEIRSMRAFLQAGLPDLPAAPLAAAPPPSDPNVFPFSLEASAYGESPALLPRSSQAPVTPRFAPPTGGAIQPRGFVFRGGQLRFPAEASHPIVSQVLQNQMLNIEFAIFVSHNYQGDARAPAPLFVLGEDLASCNLAITQESNNYFLLLRTTSAPEQGGLHRIPLGTIQGGRFHHMQITYRSGELTVYRNGVESRKLRGEINGLLSNWKPAPLLFGGLPNPEPTPENPAPAFVWTGTLVQFYLRASLDTPRAVTNNFNRFSSLISR